MLNFKVSFSNMNPRKNPRTETELMIRSFVQSSVGLLTVTRQSFENYDNGFYGILFARPSTRLSSLLAIEREIIIVFSTFDDQQTRTIRATKAWIENEEGRVESTIAILVHADPSGNAKLKRWGRDEGISILPIFYDGDIPKQNDFERVLCRELFSHDPFDVTGPVSDDIQFYGRRTEAQDLARHLQKGQIRSCLGIRKCGKTSMLNRVMMTVRSSHDCYAIMVDCSKDSIWNQTASHLMQSLAEAVQVAQQGSERYAVVREANGKMTMSQSGDTLLKVIESSDLPIVLFIDEVDYITPGSPTAVHWREDFNPFWRNLRAVYQEAGRQGKRFSILIGGVSSKWFSVEEINGIENAALSLVPEEYLSPLARGASIPMIKSIARMCGLQFDDENATPIAETCSDIPFWIRKAGSFLHRNIDFQNRPLRPDSSVVKELLIRFVEIEGIPLAQVAVSHLFRVYPELEIPASHALTGAFGKIAKNILNQLERYGILTWKGGQIGISGEMMRQALTTFFEQKNHIPLIESGDHVESRPQLEFGSDDEWAEELALISKRRNLLEKKLREIALNFLRFDYLGDKKRKTPLERILSVWPSEKRSKFAAATPEISISKFMWTDLIKLIEAEWPLFHAIFSDKKLFSENAGIVNDRFDAHAKAADYADIALSRRSLKWLEDCAAGI